MTLSFAPGMNETSLEAAWLAVRERATRAAACARGSGARLPERIADILTAESGLGGAAMSQIPRERRAAACCARCSRATSA